MTKAELIEALRNVDDGAEVKVYVVPHGEVLEGGEYAGDVYADEASLVAHL